MRLLAERYYVEAVPDGQSALASVRERSPELVLTDVMMPNLDGFALLRQLRSDPKARTIPVIVISARAETGATLRWIPGQKLPTIPGVQAPFWIKSRGRETAKLRRLRRNQRGARLDANKRRKIARNIR